MIFMVFTNFLTKKHQVYPGAYSFFNYQKAKYLLCIPTKADIFTAGVAIITPVDVCHTA